MIRLTYVLGGEEGAIWVPETIIITEVKGKALVSIPAIEGHWEVVESPSEVARKVLLHNLAKSDYASGNENVKETARLALMDLSGLETGGTTE